LSLIEQLECCQNELFSDIISNSDAVEGNIP
jgi:hypothetical protein